ncbi:MAG: chromate transporter [Treponema sp.]|jgi:chromate transporter|nr:chromate transporter [Treponema sp.]
MNLIYLFAIFFKIGLFSIGGGLATLPFIFELADNASSSTGEPWLTREMIGNMLAVAQSLPGAVGANLSSYTGFRYTGISGGYAAALGLIAPSIIIIIIVARMLKAFKENSVVKSLFAGFRPAAAGLLSAAGFGAISLSLWDPMGQQWYEYLRWKETMIFGIIFFLVFKFKKHPIIYILAAGLTGVFLKL